MKRLAIALSFLGLSTTLFAALPATIDPTLIAVPQLPGGFVIGGTAYYLEPFDMHGDLNYAASFGIGIRSVEPGYDFGWGVNVGYIFPNTGNDVNLSYFHLDADERDSAFGSPVGNQFITADIQTTGANVTVSNYLAHAKAEYNFDRVDLTTGQFIDVGSRLVLHPAVGISYLSLDRDLDSTYAGSATGLFSAGTFETITDNTTIHEKSNFDGIGPLANLDASYYLGLGVGLIAHADAGLYIGDIDVKTDAFRSVADTVFATTTRFFSAAAVNALSADSNRHIVPVTEIKFGADYTYLFSNAANSDLTLEVGYQVSHYFNAVDRFRSTLSSALVNLAGTLFTIGSPNINGRTTTGVSLNGPYVNLSWHI